MPDPSVLKRCLCLRSISWRRGGISLLVAFKRGHVVLVIIITKVIRVDASSKTTKIRHASSTQLGEVNATKVAALAAHATHAAKLVEVLLGRLFLLVLVDPLVKVGLEEVQPLRVLDLGVKLELDVV